MSYTPLFADGNGKVGEGILLAIKHAASQVARGFRTVFEISGFNPE